MENKKDSKTITFQDYLDKSTAMLTEGVIHLRNHLSDQNKRMEQEQRLPETSLNYLLIASCSNSHMYTAASTGFFNDQRMIDIIYKILKSQDQPEIKNVILKAVEKYKKETE